MQLFACHISPRCQGIHIPKEVCWIMVFFLSFYVTSSFLSLFVCFLLSFTSKMSDCLVNTDNVIWATSWQNQQNERAPSEDSDQPGHPPSLIRVFAVRVKKAVTLSYPLSAQRRLWSDWTDAQADLSLRWAHIHFAGFVMSRLICTSILKLKLCQYEVKLYQKNRTEHNEQKRIEQNLFTCQPWDTSLLPPISLARLSHDSCVQTKDKDSPMCQ